MVPMPEDIKRIDAAGDRFIPAGKVPLAEVPITDKGGFDIQKIVTSEAGMGFNALLVHVHGEHPRKRMLGTTTRVYHVIEGTGTFALNDEQHAVAQGDTFVIPPGNEYEYQGTMKLFEFNVSPDNVFSDQVTYEKSAQ
jgi:mannose-6-phosphate isomerase-like protein (cupin superfamily)